MNDLELMMDSRENVDAERVDKVRIDVKNLIEINKPKQNGKQVSTQKPLSELINEISKILHLPQNLISDAKCILNQDNSLFKQDNSRQKQDNSVMRQNNSIVRQDIETSFTV